MTRLSKRRCSGCDCLNQAVPLTESDKDIVCCNDYGFCLYVATFECECFAKDGERLTEPCLVFRKDCVKGCQYSSRWHINDQGDDLPSIRMAKCIRTDARKGCGANDGVADTDAEAQQLTGWDGRCIWGTEDCEYEQIEDDNCWVKWRLIFDEYGQPSLLLETRSGKAASYGAMDESPDCDSLDDERPIRFSLQLDDACDSDLLELPPTVCLQPLPNPEIDNPCYPPEARCACCDAGGETMRVEITGCQPPESENYEWYANLTRGAALPCGVATPDPEGSCDYFWGVFSAYCDRREEYVPTGVLAWCQDGGWQSKLYCERIACYVDTGISPSVVCKCDGATVELTLNNCCCPACPNNVCGPHGEIFYDCPGLGDAPVFFWTNGTQLGQTSPCKWTGTGSACSPTLVSWQTELDVTDPENAILSMFAPGTYYKHVWRLPPGEVFHLLCQNSMEYVPGESIVPEGCEQPNDTCVTPELACCDAFRPDSIMPSTLTAELEYCCGAYGTTSTTLTANRELRRWEAVIPMCGGALTLHLFCNASLSVGCGPGSYGITATLEGSFCGDFEETAGAQHCSCDPFQSTYLITGLIMSCCPALETIPLTIVITE